ncbi:hypothetical protein CPB85DRAFT_119805 [Mucidula mucida]|nr:hypothetical protein CPB85DRAFT_119805 [Mucidula mucida]
MTSPLTTTPMPTNTNGHHSPRDSNTQLAHLLSEAYKQIDLLSQRVQDETRRAEHWEKIASQGTPDILSLQKSLHEAFCERDEERARRVAMTDQWQQLRDYLTILDANSREARGLLDRLFQMDGGVVRDQRMEYPPIPLIDEVHRDRRHYRDAGRRKRKRSLSPSVDEMILEAADAPEPHHNTEPFPQPPSLSPSVSSMSPIAGTVRPSTGSFQTHIFAPVVTGAPIKRTKYTNTGHLSASNSNANANSLTRSDTLITSTTDVSAVPAKIYPATNELGQRICRACGQPGRYKEEKCIEKWGPGPMGPGTVCDRCRKKIKRVERKNTLGSAPVPQLAGNNLPQCSKRIPGQSALLIHLRRQFTERRLRRRRSRRMEL